MLNEGKFSLIQWENEHAHKLTQLRERDTFLQTKK